MEIVLVSFFKSNNLGDLLITKELEKLINKHSETYKLFAFPSGEEVESTLDSNLQINMNLNGNYKQPLSTKIKKYLPDSISYQYYNAQKINHIEYENAIKHADCLVIGGGNMIYDDTSKSLSAIYFNYFVETAKKYNKKVFAISIGVGPFITKYQKNKAIIGLKQCDFVTVRDKRSFDLIRGELDINESNIAPDPVFFMDNIRENNQKNNIIALNIINNPVYRENKLTNIRIIKNYVSLINKITDQTNYKLRMFSTDSSDYEVINDVFNDLSSSVQERIEVVYIDNQSTLLNLYKTSDLLIGTRMHSMIVAYSQRLPVIGLAWQPKVYGMFELMDMSENCFDLLTIDRHENIEAILSLIENIDEELYRNKINNNIDKLSEQYQVNNKILERIAKNESI